LERMEGRETSEQQTVVVLISAFVRIADDVLSQGRLVVARVARRAEEAGFRALFQWVPCR
jgi:hypothetical protein